MRIQCFGGFDIFVDNQPLLIPWAKAKELLAYLVHKRGASISSGEIAAVLWEDREYTHSLRNQTQRVIGQLMGILAEADAGDILRRKWNSLAIVEENVTCDFYDFLLGKPYAIHAYMGDYMQEYSWAEPVVNYLNNKGQ